MLITESLFKRFLIRSLISLAFYSIVCLPVFAAKKAHEKWYEIEIIVFSQDLAANYNTEIWLDKPGFPNIKNSVDHYTSAESMLADDLDVNPLYFVEPDFDPNNKDTLQKYARRIKSSAKYQLLIHRSWRQTLAPAKVYLTDKPNSDPIVISEEVTQSESTSQPKSAEDMLLEALLKEEKDFSSPLSHLPAFISERDQIQPFDETDNLPDTKYTALSFNGPLQHLVYGYFKLSKGRYLHMDLDFLYRGEPYIPALEELSIEEVFPMSDNLELEKQSIENAKKMEALSRFIPKEKPPIPGFRIKDSKRIRLNNIYYTDHPLFGIIVRIIKYKLPPPDEEVNTSS